MSSFNRIWETEIYGKGNHLNRYPYDNMVTFIYRNYPRQKKREEIEILEVGCGAGNNLWFAAREGFKVTGIDGSTSAINYCKERFANESLQGNFVVGDFVSLPFDSNKFDIVLDRCSLTCLSKLDCASALKGINRVMKEHGRFIFNVYSDVHSSHAAGKTLESGLTVDIGSGNLKGVGGISFYNESDLRKMFQDWTVLSMRHKKIDEVLARDVEVHAEWEVIAEKC